MIDAYKRFPLKYQLVAIGVLTVIAAFIGWKEDHSPLIVGGLTLTGLIVLHLFLSKLNSMLAFIVIVIISVTYAALIIAVYIYGGTAAQLLTIDINLIAVMLTSFGLAMLASYVWVASSYSRGRLWINLLTAFVLSTITSLLILVINPFFYIAALVVGYIVGLAFLILRKPNHKKRQKVIRPGLSTNNRTAVEKLFENSKLKYTSVAIDSDLSGSHYFAYNDRNAFAITVVIPSKTFSITPSGIVSDGKNITPLLEHAHEQMRANRKEIQPELVSHILLVVSSSKNLKNLSSVSIPKWKQPDNILGVTNIVTTKGFERFVRAVNGEMKPLSEKKQKKITNFYENLTSTQKV